MNIFVTNTSPITSAVALDDKRLNKMILESTQLLCTAVIKNGGTAPYKATHVNHPCTQWVISSRGNYDWLMLHVSAMLIDYTIRFGKKHKCGEVIDVLCNTNTRNVLPDLPQTPFANCTANQSKGVSFKHIENTVEAYKMYLNERWKTDTRKPVWTNRKKPEWANV